MNNPPQFFSVGSYIAQGLSETHFVVEDDLELLTTLPPECASKPRLPSARVWTQDLECDKHTLS